MAQKHTLKAEPRARTGSGLLKQMRREGWLPSVIYGKGSENKNLKVDAKAFHELLGESASENLLINLELAGEGKLLAFLQDVQHDPLTGEPLHADFRSVNEKTEITAHVPVTLNGTPEGVKEGGVLEQMLHALEVRCAVNVLPEEFEFDVSALKEGESLHIGDVKLPDGVVAQYGEEVQIAHIGRSSAAISEASTEGEEAPVVEEAAPAEA